MKLTSDFENNGKFKLEIKTLANKKKLHHFILDFPEPFVKHFNLLKVLKKVELDFFQLNKNHSNSNLNIFDFKVKEMPALTKLLSLASFKVLQI